MILPPRVNVVAWVHRPARVPDVERAVRDAQHRAGTLPTARPAHLGPRPVRLTGVSIEWLITGAGPGPAHELATGTEG